MKAPSSSLAGPPLELIRSINDLLPAYVAYVDADLRYVAANQMYVDRFGRPEEQIVGQLVADVTGASFEHVVGHLKAALAGETQYLEPRMISVDGDRILSVTHLPHRDEAGAVIGVIVYGYDITEQRRAEAALLQSEKLAAVGRLASSIAHEINNPLESVTNLLYLLGQTVEQDPQQARQYVELAQRELSRVSVITTQTLRFFKQSTGRQRADMPELMDSVLVLYAGKLVNSQIEVKREYGEGAQLVCFDGELRQAMNNLVGNAIDAMRNGGQLRVRARCATDFATARKGIRLTVADSGIGMARETQARIFEPFFTTKGIVGTGLGLWITQELVSKAQGRLRVRSRAGEMAHADAAHVHGVDGEAKGPVFLQRGTSRQGTVFSLFLPDDV